MTAFKSVVLDVDSTVSAIEGIDWLAERRGALTAATVVALTADAMEARVPLDEGALTGSISEQTEFEPTEFRAFYFRGDRKKHVVEHVTALQKDLGATGETLADTALRFCLSHPALSSVIPGMRRIRNVEGNMAVSERGSLPAETLEILARHAWHKNYYH